MNSARSAFACFLFKRSFFLSYHEKGVASSGGGVASSGGTMAQNDGAEPLKCKISNKVSVECYCLIVGSA